MLEVVVLEGLLRRLQAVLTIYNPEFSILDSRPIRLCRSGCQPLGHDADGLPIPLYVIHEVVDLPLHPTALARPYHTLVRGLFELKEVHVEREGGHNCPKLL